MKKIIILTLIFLMFAVPMLALGAPAPAGAPDTRVDAPNLTTTEIINRVVNLIWWVIIAGAALAIIIAAVLFLTSAGDGEKIEKARGYVLGAILAIVVGAAARGLAKFVT
ncbi:MAG: hypothetical protein KY054_02740 [Candidatus Nealsonbacteria bacterium]|nr:hypothetical protein [Candidatus Nealsonbacteria bacterium]